MNKSNLVTDKVDKSLRLLDEVIDEIEEGARILDMDMSDSSLECLCNDLLEKGISAILVYTIKERLLMNRRKRENRLVKARVNS